MALLLDAAGIVFFILFLTSQATVQKLKKQRAHSAVDMQYMRNLNMQGVDDPIKDVPAKTTFISAVDGLEQVYVYTPPAHPTAASASTLFVYFHGMGSNSLEPYLAPKDRPIARVLLRENPHAALISPDYRGDSAWLNDNALLDVDQNIKDVLYQYPADRIILVGTSMGGCSALAYSYLAAPEIRNKIKGVLSCEGAGDLEALYKETGSDLVRAGLRRAFGNAPETIPQAYQRVSILKNLGQVDTRVRYAILSAGKDAVVPPAMQAAVVEGLQKRGAPVKRFDFAEKHGVPESDQYIQGLSYLMTGK